MICDDSSQSQSHMSIDTSSKSPFKFTSPIKLLNNSWYDDAVDETCARASMDLSALMGANSNKETESIPPIISEHIKPEITIKVENAEASTNAATTTINTQNLSFLNLKEILKKESTSKTSPEREIEIEFLDASNEEKFDRLVKADKIKTPLKRRLSINSNGSRSSSPSTADTDNSAGSPAERRNAVSNKSDTKKLRIDKIGAKKRTESGGSCESGQGSSGGGSFTRFGNRNDMEMETNEETLVRRQKQIDYGKNTIGYDIYLKTIPKNQRKKEHPRTPIKCYKYSRRAWDGLIKVWRKKLHCWDPANMKKAAGNMEKGTDSSDSSEDEAQK